MTEIGLADLDSDGDLDAFVSSLGGYFLSSTANEVWLNADIDGDVVVGMHRQPAFPIPGDVVEYTFEFTNASAEDRPVLLESELDERLLDVQWSCTTDESSTCGASDGMGTVTGTSFLSVNSVAVYHVTAKVPLDANRTIRCFGRHFNEWHDSRSRH